MLETEAKDKVCVELSGLTSDAYNDGEFKYRNCIGSSCMKWQWEIETNNSGAPKNDSTTRGYCGLVNL